MHYFPFVSLFFPFQKNTNKQRYGQISPIIQSPASHFFKLHTLMAHHETCVIFVRKEEGEELIFVTKTEAVNVESQHLSRFQLLYVPLFRESDCQVPKKDY